MNDFTKEELQEIMENIKISEITVGAQRFNLVNKIQTMIDNYCEHDWNELQWSTIRKIKSMLNDCHHIDIIIRHNGEDKQFEGDFIKQLLRKL